MPKNTDYTTTTNWLDWIRPVTLKGCEYWCSNLLCIEWMELTDITLSLFSLEMKGFKKRQIILNMIPFINPTKGKNNNWKQLFSITHLWTERLRQHFHIRSTCVFPALYFCNVPWNAKLGHAGISRYRGNIWLYLKCLHLFWHHHNFQLCPTQFTN